MTIMAIKMSILLGESTLTKYTKHDQTTSIDTKVKNGGDMIGGRQYICMYISYKNELGVNTGFLYRQLTPESEPFIEVHKRQVRKKNEESGMIEEKVFTIEAEDEAVSLYKKFLSEVIQ